MGFDFSIEYEKGKENIVTDALSRKEENDEATFAAISQPILNYMEAIREETAKNSILVNLCKLVKEGEALGP